MYDNTLQSLSYPTVNLSSTVLYNVDLEKVSILCFVSITFLKTVHYQLEINRLPQVCKLTISSSLRAYMYSILLTFGGNLQIGVLAKIQTIVCESQAAMGSHDNSIQES